MRSAMIEKDVATECLVEPAALWRWVWRVKFLEGAVIRTQTTFETEDAAFEAAEKYVDGVTG